MSSVLREAGDAYIKENASYLNEAVGDNSCHILRKRLKPWRKFSQGLCEPCIGRRARPNRDSYTSLRSSVQTSRATAPASLTEEVAGMCAY